MLDPERKQGDQLFSEVGEHLEQMTGETSDLLDTAVFTVQMRRVIREHLENGNIPMVASVDDDGNISQLTPALSEEDLRSLFAEMGISQDVIDQRIEMAKNDLGLYKD